MSTPADIDIEAINAAPRTLVRAQRQARVAQSAQAIRQRATASLSELSNPSGIAGAAALARLDLEESTDSLRAELARLAAIIDHPQADPETVTMARSVRADLLDLLTVLIQATAVGVPS